MDLHAKRGFLLGKLSLMDVWSIVVGLTFVGAGLSRFIPATGVYEELLHLGVPPWLIVVSGLTETLGGSLILAPRSRFLGAGICGASMVGATFTNLRAGAYVDALSPVILGLMALSVFLVYREQGLRWLDRLRSKGGDR